MLVPVQNPAVSGHGLCTPYNHAPVRTSALHFRSIYVWSFTDLKTKNEKLFWSQEVKWKSNNWIVWCWVVVLSRGAVFSLPVWPLTVSGQRPSLSWAEWVSLAHATVAFPDSVTEFLFYPNFDAQVPQFEHCERSPFSFQHHSLFRISQFLGPSSSAVLQWVPVASGVQARTPFVFVWCVNLSLCFATDVSAWKARFAVGYLVLPNGVPLVYWLEKACSTYPRLTGSTSTSHCMTRAAPRQSAISFGSPCP